MGHVSCRVWPQEEGVTEVMPALFPRGLAGTCFSTLVYMWVRKNSEK